MAWRSFRRRPYRARDKAKAEVGVQVVQRWIVRGLAQAQVLLPRRGQPGHCRTAGAAQPAAVSQARGQPRQPVRATGPAGAEAVAGHALPVRSMEGRPASTSTITLKSSGIITACRTRWLHQEVDAHLTAETLEVLHRGVRVASHVRSYEPGKATTLTEHMPKGAPEVCGADAFAAD